MPSLNDKASTSSAKSRPSDSSVMKDKPTKATAPGPEKPALPTPESTPGPDLDRLKADKARQEADTAAKPKKQKKTQGSVPVENLATITEMQPVKNDIVKTDTIAQDPLAPTADFAPNAEGDESSDDEEQDEMQVEPPPVPGNLEQELYSEATPYMEKLAVNPEDEPCAEAIQRINRRIATENEKEGRGTQDLVIRLPTFLGHFRMAKGYLDVLANDPKDQNASAGLEKLIKELTKLNEYYHYPSRWNFQLPSKQGNADQVSEEIGAMPTPNDQGGVKTKVSVSLPDEENGNTSLGKVIYVKRAGYGTRVVVNRGTDLHPCYQICPGSTFIKGSAKIWSESGEYESEDMLKSEKPLRILGRVTVDRRSPRMEKSRHEIQYYIVVLRDRTCLATRSVMTQCLGSAKFRQTDTIVGREQQKLLTELNKFRENNQHPDTGKLLTEFEQEEMPWLVPEDADPEDRSDDDDDDEVEVSLPKTTLEYTA